MKMVSEGTIHNLKVLTRNDVYETLCPQPFACQEGFITEGFITQGPY